MIVLYKGSNWSMERETMQFRLKKSASWMLFVLFISLTLSACANWQSPIKLPGDGTSGSTGDGTAAAPQQQTPSLNSIVSKPVAQAVPPCTTGPSCGSLVITQAGRPVEMAFTAQGIQAASRSLRPFQETQNSQWLIDTGTPSPDGKWTAYTTIGHESGGPVLLQNMSTGEWTNLIETVNAHLPKDQPQLPLNAGWDVIGWFPGGAGLMIGPTDLSQVTIVDIANFSVRPIGFPGNGNGGRLFVNLAPDGKSILYIGNDASGNQVLSSIDLITGKQVDLLKLSYEQGVLYNPRFSPDQKSIAYLMQQGQPGSGINYSINLVPVAGGQPRPLVGGGVEMTVPTWSPDGKYIAFTRSKSEQTLRVAEDATPMPEQASLWVISPADGTQTQVANMDGSVRSPVWAKDSKTLAFVTQDGQVNVASVDQPGKTWQAAGPSSSP
jgi:hypothetical protein